MVVGAASAANGQVIRGVVTEVGSGARLAGSLVTLRGVETAQDTGSAIRNVITNQLGEYAIAVPGAGRYRLTVRRIGVRAWRSDVLNVSNGETVLLDVAMDPFATLPRVTVADRSLCTTGRDGPRVAALWREAETALTVIVISAQDSTVRRRLVRFKRSLDLQGEVTDESYHSTMSTTAWGTDLPQPWRGFLVAVWLLEGRSKRHHLPRARRYRALVTLVSQRSLLLRRGASAGPTRSHRSCVCAGEEPHHAGHSRHALA
jgi:hypothetical protein